MEAPSTRTTLLSRLRNGADQAAWRDFEARYRPLMVQFCLRRGLHAADADDVAQQVLAALTTALPKFLYDPQRGRFRSYLFRCTQNAIADWARCPTRRNLPLDTTAAENLAGSDGHAGQQQALWDKEWVAHHYRRALETIRATFAPQSVEIFERMVQGATVAQLAEQYGMSEDAITKVRQRVRARMEQLIAEQIAEEDDIDAGPPGDK